MPADVFKDDDRSASTFATRQRENFKLLREGIVAGRFKIVWFWATSRQTRGDVPLDVLAGESADHGVLWCVLGQLLNPANGDDHLFLTIHYIMDRQYSWRDLQGLPARAPCVRVVCHRAMHAYTVVLASRPEAAGRQVHDSVCDPE